jgi:ketosteroid isomerase-like protein
MTSTSQDHEQIGELLAELTIGMRDRDPERLVARYAPDVVKFDLAPPLQNADPRNADALRGWFTGFDGPIDYEIRDLAITAADDIAFCHSLNRMSAVPRGQTEGFDLWFRATFGLRKIDGRWLITHEHTSTPFHMDGSFAAALDLTP